MNWKQLYASATPEEREYIIFLMLQKIEARKNRKILLSPLSKSALDLGRGWGWGLVKERRGPFAGAHFLNDRRRPISRNLFRALFVSIMLTVTIALFLVAIHIPLEYGAPLILFYDIALIALLLIKPYKKISSSKWFVLERSEGG